MTLPAVHPFLTSLLQARDTPPLPADQAWEKIIRDATRHGLLPILYRWLKTSDPRYLPSAPKLGQIKEGVMGVAVRNVVLAQELASILRAFQVRQVVCVPVRGLALAELLYGDIAARPMGDIDLLVHKEDLSGVATILKELGFHEVDHRPGFARAFSYTLEFFKDRHGWIIVEPHWTIAYPPFVDRVDMDQVWKRCVRGRVVGVDTWLLGRADLLLHLCLHIIHQGKSAPLLWFYELDRFLRQATTAPDWRELVSIARKAGLELFVEEVLGKGKDLFDSPIPDEVLLQLRTPLTPHPIQGVERAVKSRAVHLLVQKLDVYSREEIALLCMLKGTRARLRYALGLLFPSPEFMRLQYGPSGRWQLARSYVSRFVRLSWEGLKGLLGLLVSSRTPRHWLP